MKNVVLIGPRGMMPFIWNEQTGAFKCSKCPWCIDAYTMAQEQRYELGVWHECSKIWPGFTRYTIRPERYGGRRTD